MKKGAAATHQNENDKAKQQADQHHRVDDRQPVNLQDKDDRKQSIKLASLVAVRQNLAVD